MSQPRDADSFYVQDCRQVQSNTHSIQTLTGQVSRLVGTLNSEKDFQNCRRLVDDAVRKASETKTILVRIREYQQQAQMIAEKNNRRMMYQKLSDNLSITVRVLEDVVRRFTAEERRRASTLEVFDHDHFGTAAADAAGGGNQPLLGAGLSLELDEDIGAQKLQALRRVDEDVLCLQRICTDLATAAQEQQASFDTLESNIADSRHDIERGRDELAMMKYGWAARLKRKFWLIAGGLLAVVTVGSLLSGS